MNQSQKKRERRSNDKTDHCKFMNNQSSNWLNNCTRFDGELRLEISQERKSDKKFIMEDVDSESFHQLKDNDETVNSSKPKEKGSKPFKLKQGKEIKKINYDCDNKDFSTMTQNDLEEKAYENAVLRRPKFRFSAASSSITSFLPSSLISSNSPAKLPLTLNFARNFRSNEASEFQEKDDIDSFSDNGNNVCNILDNTSNSIISNSSY